MCGEKGSKATQLASRIISRKLLASRLSVGRAARGRLRNNARQCSNITSGSIVGVISMRRPPNSADSFRISADVAPKSANVDRTWSNAGPILVKLGPHKWPPLGQGSRHMELRPRNLPGVMLVHCLSDYAASSPAACPAESALATTFRVVLRHARRAPRDSCVGICCTCSRVEVGGHWVRFPATSLGHRRRSALGGSPQEVRHEFRPWPA